MQLSIELILDIKSFIKKNYREDIYRDNGIYSCSNEIRTNTYRNHNDNLRVIEINTDETWQESLFKMIDERNLKDSDVYKKGSVSKQTFSKIRSNRNYQPNKDTAIQLCFGLELDLIKSKRLLEKAGYTLSKSIKRDVVIMYFIEHKIYNIDLMNMYFEREGYKLFSIN